jgi:hypothetical protein
MRFALPILWLAVWVAPASATLVEVPDDLPVIGPPGDPAVSDIFQSATAPNPVDDTSLFAWTVDDSIGPQDLLGGVIDANFPAGVLTPPLDATDGFIRDPAAAYDLGTGQWLVVWAQEDAPGAYEIYGRTVFTDGTIGAAAFRISEVGTNDTDPAFDALQPAVASNEAGKFIVLWAADDDVFGLADGNFDIFYRSVDAQSEALGAVVQHSAFGAGGGAALEPAVAYTYQSNGWLVAYEGDAFVGPGDPYAPSIFAGVVFENAVPRTVETPESAIPVAARAASASWRNPAIAVDRLNQQTLLIWDELDAGEAVARRICGVRYDAFAGILEIPVFRDLDVEGHGPSSYVRDVAVTHNRISGSYLVAWRESLNPATGVGQTLQILEYDEAVGIVTPPFSFVNQGVPGPLPTEIGPPVIEGGWRTNGRSYAIWSADVSTKGEMGLWFQAFDLGAAVSAPPQAIPVQFAVKVAPNPFNPRTSVQLALPVDGRARVDIYDVRGRLVRNLLDEDLPAGNHSRTWEGQDDRGQGVASGVYMIKVQHPGGSRVTKVSLVE